MKLYQEVDRPEDSIGYIRNILNEGALESEEMKVLKEEMAKLAAEKEKVSLELQVASSQIKKTTSEADTMLTTKFKALEADQTGNSLLKEYLTEEIMEKLKILKTDLGGSLLDNIQCGLTHFDADIGIYASDQSAYHTFALLFDPVLEDIHDAEGEGDEPTPVTQPELDWGNSEDLNDLDPEGLFIKSISITIGRSLDGVQFMPTIKLEKLQEITEKIREAFTTITDEEFEGKYYELADIEEDQKTKWIEDGTLFQEPNDKFLKAAETYRFWSLARGVFINQKNNLRVWINEEEHLQITSYDIGANLSEVYKRLVKLMGLIDGLTFARDPRWGFVGHNLKNIGNTIRIKVKAKIPQLSLPENNDKLQSFSDGNNITTKDLGSGMMELTNSKRMGMTEIDTAKGFQKGILELINAEKCLYAP